MRRRPNYQANRYNQHVIAGKIAVATGTINPIDPETGRPYPIYRTNEDDSLWERSRLGISKYIPILHYAVIGQDYLTKLGISVIEL